jgi:serine/threonine protein phosphatase PrpC
MIARLRGMVQALKPPEDATEGSQELLPTWDSPAESPAPLPDAVPAESTVSTEPELAPTPIESPRAPPAQLCPYCQAPRSGEESYCANCGWIFPPPTVDITPPSEPTAETRLKDRYVLGRRLGERGDVVRFQARDTVDAVPVVVLRAPRPPAPEASTVEAQAEPVAAVPVAEVASEPIWPSIAWERTLLERAAHSALPRPLDAFHDDAFDYLVEEVPTGTALWDAWDDPEATADQRFGWLHQLAEALQRLLRHGAILEGLRPDIVVVTPEGQARLTDLSDLLPFPLPPNPPIRATCYTAPELVLTSDKADARAALYGFGAMLYALHTGRELTELDFELQGVPKSFLQRFPDVHPLFGRLVSKTFCRDPNARFPTEEAAKEDSSGFTELLHVLDTCRRTLDRVRLEIGAWTTTGMVRTGNEDGFVLLHGTTSREDDLDEAALILLADGMGGYESGEVAAAMALQCLRRRLLQQQPFAALARIEEGEPEERAEDALDVEACKELLAAALRDANQQVYTASRARPGRHPMGCTAEAVYIRGRHLLVGHVGDSRTYLLHRGRLEQITRDQTWVNRMVELGALRPEEAESHPRRMELQQAIGGHSEVEPALYDRLLQAGAWVLVCSDGVPTHLPPHTLHELLLRASSAEGAARRIVNLVNLAGGSDNATVVVVRVS